jgi:hypothetical protein
MKISRVTGFPFHPPADKQEDTLHVIGHILQATHIVVMIFAAPETHGSSAIIGALVLAAFFTRRS